MANDWTYASIQDMTNGGADDLDTLSIVSGLPSGLVSLQILYLSISTTTANETYVVRLGTAGGLQTTGYLCDAGATSGEENNYTTGFISVQITGHDAADLYSGIMELYRYDESAHLWFMRGAAQEHGKTAPRNTYGQVTLGGELTQLEVLTDSETGIKFDDGEIRVRYR